MSAGKKYKQVQAAFNSAFERVFTVGSAPEVNALLNEVCGKALYFLSKNAPSNVRRFAMVKDGVMYMGRLATEQERQQSVRANLALDQAMFLKAHEGDVFEIDAYGQILTPGADDNTGNPFTPKTEIL